VGRSSHAGSLAWRDDPLSPGNLLTTVAHALAGRECLTSSPIEAETDDTRLAKQELRATHEGGAPAPPSSLDDPVQATRGTASPHVRAWLTIVSNPPAQDREYAKNHLSCVGPACL